MPSKVDLMAMALTSTEHKRFPDIIVACHCRPPHTRHTCQTEVQLGAADYDVRIVALQPQTETIPIRWHVLGMDGAWAHVDAGFTTYCCGGYHPVYYLTQATCAPISSPATDASNAAVLS